MTGGAKPLVWLSGQIKTPPFSSSARVEAGPRCHELRVVDERVAWRIVYRVDADAVVIGEVFEKKTSETPHRVIQACQGRLRAYDLAGRS